MSFDGIIFRESAQCVPWRHTTEVPSSWKEGCSLLAGIAEECAGEGWGRQGSAHLCRHRPGPSPRPCGGAPGLSLQVSDGSPRASAGGMACQCLWRSSPDTSQQSDKRLSSGFSLGWEHVCSFMFMFFSCYSRDVMTFCTVTQPLPCAPWNTVPDLPCLFKKIEV